MFLANRKILDTVIMIRSSIPIKYKSETGYHWDYIDIKLSIADIELTKMLETMQYINGMNCVTIIRKGETSDDYILKSTQK